QGSCSQRHQARGQESTRRGVEQDRGAFSQDVPGRRAARGSAPWLPTRSSLHWRGATTATTSRRRLADGAIGPSGTSAVLIAKATATSRSALGPLASLRWEVRA